MLKLINLLKSWKEKLANEIKREQKTESFLTNSPKRGRVKENSVAVRKEGKVQNIKIEKFIEYLKKEISERK